MAGHVTRVQRISTDKFWIDDDRLDRDVPGIRNWSSKERICDHLLRTKPVENFVTSTLLVNRRRVVKKCALAHSIQLMHQVVHEDDATDILIPGKRVDDEVSFACQFNQPRLDIDALDQEDRAFGLVVCALECQHKCSMDQ